MDIQGRELTFITIRLSGRQAIHHHGIVHAVPWPALMLEVPARMHATESQPARSAHEKARSGFGPHCECCREVSSGIYRFPTTNSWTASGSNSRLVINPFTQKLGPLITFAPPNRGDQQQHYPPWHHFRMRKSACQYRLQQPVSKVQVRSSC